MRQVDSLFMSLTNRNDRSIHTDHKRITASLKQHADLMARYVSEGLSQKEASKMAFRDLQGYTRRLLHQAPK